MSGGISFSGKKLSVTFAEWIRKHIHDHYSYGVIHICEAWAHVSKQPNKHTLKQSRDGHFIGYHFARYASRRMLKSFRQIKPFIRLNQIYSSTFTIITAQSIRELRVSIARFCPCLQAVDFQSAAVPGHHQPQHSRSQ